MRGDYGTLVSEQLICAMQVHVSVADRDLAVAVANRVAPWLSPLLALSASFSLLAGGRHRLCQLPHPDLAALANDGGEGRVRLGRGLRPDRG